MTKVNLVFNKKEKSKKNKIYLYIKARIRYNCLFDSKNLIEKACFAYLKIN